MYLISLLYRLFRCTRYAVRVCVWMGIYRLHFNFIMIIVVLLFFFDVVIVISRRLKLTRVFIYSAHTAPATSIDVMRGLRGTSTALYLRTTCWLWPMHCAFSRGGNLFMTFVCVFLCFGFPYVQRKQSFFFRRRKGVKVTVTIGVQVDTRRCWACCISNGRKRTRPSTMTTTARCTFGRSVYQVFWARISLCMCNGTYLLRRAIGETRN